MINSNLNSVAGNVRSYDLGNQPFKHDVGRGKWDTIWDFYAVALSHCLGFRHLTLFFLISKSNVVGIFLSYLLGLFILVLPLYYMQMFLGQFSSSGLISAFRIAPLFKVIGYVSLFLNIMTCTYLMVSAAFPLSIVFDSIQSELPWTHCNNSYNTHKCSLQVNDTNDIETTFPIDEYFDHITGRTISNGYDGPFLWRIILCTLLVWLLIGGILSKGAEMFGKIFRFTTTIMLSCFLLTLIRMLCVEESWTVLKNFIMHLPQQYYMENILNSPILIISAFGAGWGNILTIASYNNFKENIGKLSIVACSLQMIIFLLTIFQYEAADRYLYKRYRYFYLFFNFHDPIAFVVITFALYFSHFNWPHLWTFLFFMSIFLAQLSDGVIQVFTILTAIFDEYESTRIYKRTIQGTFIGIFGIISMLFCSNKGFSSLTALYITGCSERLIIILFELIIVLWIYGRLRFQRDVKFMTGKIFENWKIWMMRFLTPILIIFALGRYLYHLTYFSRYFIITDYSTFIIIKVVAFTLFIFCYFIYKIYSSTGNILNRIKKLCQPNDWYPVDLPEHRIYNIYFSDSDVNGSLIVEEADK
ncbi:sodium-dependent proline transporter-like [Condylostylus longicornis]|uniref:sodium-dependent proline transporter-like n=1 Tax=Condylostylus longicornis TaxID=2530218 RepID=UPI00244DEC31|nr:sodium-dependent proline transporter-like [Condylostylus longicornis]